MRITLLLAVLTSPLVAAQVPTLGNGQVDARRGSIAAEVAAAASAATPTWLGWRVPLVAGDRDLCSTWTTDRERVRGYLLESPTTNTARPRPTAPASGISLDAGTNLIVLVRVMDGRVERVRSIGDDCPIDASGQTLRWLTDVTPADSVAYLASLATDRQLGSPTPQNIHDAAISAIALHQDAAADAALDALVGPTQPTGIRTTAARWLANARGGHGFDTLSALIRNERDARTRATFVGGLWRSTSPRAGASLLALARTDADPGVRGEAAAGYARLGDSSAVRTLLDLLSTEADDKVKARIVASLDLVPGQAGVPALLQLAQPASDATVRREAVRALSRSSDPRATAYLEALLK